MPSSSSQRTLLLRGLIAAVIAGFLLIGPVVSQVFGVSTPKVYQKWRMFSGKGRKVCQVAYRVAEPDGTLRDLDHLEILGLKNRRGPIRLTRDHLPGLTQSMCRRLSARGAQSVDLRLVARCGSRGLWVDHSQAERSVCRAR